jgi:hypothetical protein
MPVFGLPFQGAALGFNPAVRFPPKPGSAAWGTLRRPGRITSRRRSRKVSPASSVILKLYSFFDLSNWSMQGADWLYGRREIGRYRPLTVLFGLRYWNRVRQMTRHETSGRMVFSCGISTTETERKPSHLAFIGWGFWRTFKPYVEPLLERTNLSCLVVSHFSPLANKDHRLG